MVNVERDFENFMETQRKRRNMVDKVRDFTVPFKLKIFEKIFRTEILNCELFNINNIEFIHKYLEMTSEMDDDLKYNTYYRM